MIYSKDRLLYPMKRVDFDPNGERNIQNRGKSEFELRPVAAQTAGRPEGHAYGGRNHDGAGLEQVCAGRDQSQTREGGAHPAVAPTETRRQQGQRGDVEAGQFVEAAGPGPQSGEWGPPDQSGHHRKPSGPGAAPGAE